MERYIALMIVSVDRQLVSGQAVCVRTSSACSSTMLGNTQHSTLQPVLLLKMVEDKVPPQHRPMPSQLKHMRPTKSSKTSLGVAVSCLGDLRQFIESLPPTIRILQYLVVCQEDDVCIPFSCPCLGEALSQCPSTCFVCDFT